MRAGRDRRGSALLCGLEILRRSRAEAVEQRGLVAARRLEVAHLDVAEAADLLRDGRDADREMMVRGAELAQQLGERRLVIGDELALGAPLGGIAERIEGGATQPFEPRT